MSDDETLKLRQEAVNTEKYSLFDGDEIHLFLHCHLRDYDRQGTGKALDGNYYDKYGSPVALANTWTHGFYMVERALTRHSDQMENEKSGFPLVSGFAGGAHLYKEHHGRSLHAEEPWNWTGWVPLQHTWISPVGKERVKHYNRAFLALRGNEIQNDLWDYDPFDEEKDEKGENHDPKVHKSLVPKDKYKGGYWFQGDARARYCHIFSLKSRHENPEEVKRYNYIVHPRAYEIALNEIPDASLDGIQWFIMRAQFEEHFGKQKKWGECINGMEIFNDFTYYFSSQPHYGYEHKNGELVGSRIVWFDTYPLEYCGFLLENALARGTYLQIIAGNDAFYQREILPFGAGKADNKEPEAANSQRVNPVSKYEMYIPSGQEALERMEEIPNILLSDPKGELAREIISRDERPIQRRGPTQRVPIIEMKSRRLDHLWSPIGPLSLPKVVLDFRKPMPYEVETVFGYTTLIDTEKELYRRVYPKEKDYPQRLDGCDDLMFDYLTRGRFFAHTGIYDIFKYNREKSWTIPYTISGQPNDKELCYEIDVGSMEMVFTFLPIKEKNIDIIWRYSLEQSKGFLRETVNGYFKLDPNRRTILDLSTRYKKANLKWIRFTAFNPVNPMKRAWFSPIKGPAFKKIDSAELPKLKHRITRTIKTEMANTVFYQESLENFSPLNFQFSPRNFYSQGMKFTLPKVDENGEKQLYAYCGQGFTRQAMENDRTINAGPIPDRILQNIQGYLALSSKYPTNLNLGKTWDWKTIRYIQFYGIDENAQPFEIIVHPSCFLL